MSEPALARGAPSAVPLAILGGSGYVAGELLRLLALHDGFAPRVVISASRAGEPIAAAFPHLASAYPELRFASLGDLDRLLAAAPRAALVSAAPHGASAPAVAAALAAAAAAGCALDVVDLSADFRFADPAAYARVYGQPHAAPGLLASFARGVPEHLGVSAASCFAHPGCFATAVLLALVPLLASGRIEPDVAVTAITGSTGSGRSPSAATHHPERRSTVVAYAPLAHRHEPEIVALAREATGVEPDLALVPQSGPHARGIYATLHARLARLGSAEEIAAEVAAFYVDSPFVSAGIAPPRLVDVAGSNRATIGVAARGARLAIFCALDNLAKGAAGGGLQWLNRRFGFPATAGLAAPGPGWL